MPAEKFTTTLVVFEIKPFHTGTNKTTQREYTIWQIRARKMDGQEITQFPLRSFDKLPLNEPVEVEAQLYDGGSYGISYTLKPLQRKNSGNSLGPRVEALEKQIAHLYQHLGIQPPAPQQEQQRAAPSAPPPAPAGPAASPPPPAPPPPAPVSAPPPTPADPPTQVQTSVAPPPPVQPEPPGGYGTHNDFGGDDDIPF